MTDDTKSAPALAGEGSTGRPAAGSMDREGGDTIGGPGLRHWRQSTVSDPTLDRRDNVFFAAVEMTRMPMVLVDPNAPDMPLAFVNNAFLDLTGYEEHEVVGRNCRFLQGADTDAASVRHLRPSGARRSPSTS